MLLEHNVVVKDPMKVDLRFASCYPNLYRSAMSSLGFHIIYDYLNSYDDIYCERVVYPQGRSLETGSLLRDFDLVGFSFQYEQDYFNVVEMLRGGGLTVRKSDRTPDDPLVIAGGPCASSNPLPMAHFIDLFLVGDGEAILPEFLAKYRELDNPRQEIEEFREVDGVYLPDFPVQMKILKNMKDAWRPVKQVVVETSAKKFIPAFGRAFLLEVSRGCTRGCRFCMAGCLYRPRREVPMKTLLKTAEKGREATNLDKIALIGAAVSDHSQIKLLCEKLVDKGFQVTLPSLRIESISESLLDYLSQGGLKTITIAPESTWRLRKVVNKGLRDDEIIRALASAFEREMNVKLYFMVGLPTETRTDLEDLVRLVKILEKKAPRRSMLRVSVNPFIPKPHTPFQWANFNYDYVKKASRYLQTNLRSHYFKTESPRTSLVQFVLSVGDVNLANLIEQSSQENVPFREWQSAAPQWTLESELPWKNIKIGVSDDYLKNEYIIALNGELTPWCEIFGCYQCGVKCNQYIYQEPMNE